jgi:hypothetical protein
VGVHIATTYYCIVLTGTISIRQKTKQYYFFTILYTHTYTGWGRDTHTVNHTLVAEIINPVTQSNYKLHTNKHTK